MSKITSVAGALALTALLPAVAQAQTPFATDPNIDPRVREFLVGINKDPSPFWELPQPKPQEI